MRTIKLLALFIIYNLTFSISYAQSPVDSVGSGCSLDFNGANYITMTPLSGVNGATYLTLQCWINFTHGTPGTIFSQWSDGSIPLGNPDGFYGLIGAGGEVWANFNAGYGVFSTTTLSVGWNFVSIVFDGTKAINADRVEIYINGIKSLKDFTWQSVPLPSSIGPYFGTYSYIGARYYNVVGSPIQYITGTLDEVRIWNKALTQTEIQQTMCKKLAGTEPNLVGYWRFDDCGGLTTIDASGNGNNGTLN